MLCFFASNSIASIRIRVSVYPVLARIASMSARACGLGRNIMGLLGIDILLYDRMAAFQCIDLGGVKRAIDCLRANNLALDIVALAALDSPALETRIDFLMRRHGSGRAGLVENFVWIVHCFGLSCRSSY